MRALCFVLVLLAAAPIAAAQTRRPDLHIVLVVGERYVVADDDLGTFYDGESPLYRMERDCANHLVLIGRSAGSTYLDLIFSNGDQRRLTIVVHPRAGAPVAPEGSSASRNYSAASTASGATTCG